MAIVTGIWDKFQTVIPAEIIKKFNLDKTFKIEWKINENGNVELEFFKNLSLDDMVGRYKANEVIDCVSLKHNLEKGESHRW